MKSINLKLSTSRKSLHRLSVRQRSRVMSEIRNNLRLLLSPKVAAAAAANNNKSNISSSFIVECSSFPECPSSVINDICNIRDNMHTESDESSFSSISDASDAASSFFNFTTQTEPSFRERLASCFVDNNLTHAQGNNILSLLRTHSCFYNLPKDVRTLLHTPRNCIAVSIVEPGEYIHFDLESSIIRCLMCVSSLSIVDQLEIDFNTDGCALDKSGSIHIWPIQYRIANIQHTKPIVAGIYKGTQKPYDPNKFFEKFIADIDRIMSNGGINLHGNKVPIRLRCFIADAPARAFILNHRGHTSSQPCSKCKVSGTRSEARYVFNDVNHPLRTDEEYIRCVDGDHHKEGKSPLSMVPIGMVSQVPFEYMHLVCLGVMKKLLSAWIYGKYSRLSKLSGRSISIMCARLNTLKEYCPSNFSRRPRSLDACSKYKATEFRQFLLYTGIVVTYGILDDQLYKHFLFLHVAIRILVSNSPSKLQLRFAELALQKFVQRSKNLYGSTFNSYNVHGLLHLTNDVRHLGKLDSFSAFPYENNMTIFRKYCRKPGLSLQQFFNRMAEIEIHGTNQNRDNDSSIHVSVQHNASLESDI
ncbi:uncharacterized protein [Polyergus mexicanus]|uniref:uncharacterized protein isoform X1 n=1 Tax=Polyergus mexicanus TaxID=615972 RepID=UPI0038B5D166